MEPQERKQIITVIRELAESINISRQRAEEARIELEQIHVRLEEEERKKNMANVSEEIQHLA